jgi:hypothetical protein
MLIILKTKKLQKMQLLEKLFQYIQKLGIWAKVFSDPNVLISTFITLILIGLAISKDKI